MLITSLVWYDRLENANNEPPRFASEEIVVGLYGRIHRAKQKLAPTPPPELKHKVEEVQEPVLSDKRKKQLGINW